MTAPRSATWVAGVKIGVAPLTEAMGDLAGRQVVVLSFFEKPADVDSWPALIELVGRQELNEHHFAMPWPNPQTAVVLEALRVDLDRLLAAGTEGVSLGTAVGALRAAIADAGPQPDIHHATLSRHRAEWPALWRAIDDLLAVGYGLGR